MSRDRIPLRLSDVLGQPCVLAALALLEGPYRCARLLKRCPWDFAVSSAELNKTGATDGQLKVLVAGGYLRRRNDPSRRSRRGEERGRPPKAVPRTTPLFVLTPVGADLAREKTAAESPDGAGGGTSANRCDPRPSWEGRVFCFGGQVLKTFRRHAPEQERILDEFQNAGWPPRLANPLVREGHAHCAKQLRDVLRLLNRGQEPWSIYFETDADGKGVRWSIRPSHS
jgi:hypothetical protein